MFRYDVEDQQLTAVGGAATPTSCSTPTRPSARASSSTSQAYLTDNLLVTLGSSYNDTEIKDADLAVAACGARLHRCTDPTAIPVDGGTDGA